MESMLGQAGPVLTTRVVGLLFFGAIYLAHRRFYRGSQVLGLSAKNGILTGIVAIAAGVIVRLAMQAWING